MLTVTFHFWFVLYLVGNPRHRQKISGPYIPNSVAEGSVAHASNDQSD